MDVPLSGIVALLGLVLVSALFSLAEGVLTLFGEARARRALSEGDKRFEAFAERPEATVFALVFGKNAGLVGASALIGMGIDHSQIGVRIVVTAVAIVLVFILVEAVPKTFASRRARGMCGPILTIGRPWFMALRPFTGMIWSATRHVVKESRTETSAGTLTEEDFVQLVEEGAQLASVSGIKERLLLSVFEFGDTTVREVMVPRTDITAVSIETPIEDLIELVVTRGHSRIPVFEQSVDNIKGIFYAKDLLRQIKVTNGRQLETEFSLEDCLKEPFFVPESRRINALFKDFQKSHVHIAVVIDEHGTTAGLVTLEDIIEELFGEIQDEYDSETPTIVEVSESCVEAEGRANIIDIGERFDVSFDDEADYDTLGGFIVTEVGEIPQVGHQIASHGLSFEVIEASDKRVERVRITSEDEDAQSTSAT